MKAITEHQVQLWLATVQDFYEPELLERYASLLSAEERARWQRFIYPADRQRFLLARALVRTVLADIVNEPDPAALQFIHNEHGKPALSGSPVHFNLSHTNGLIALAVSRKHEVGVDIESLERRVDMLALSRRFFAASEHAELLDLPGQEQRERFFALWTLKEAWLKARGLGLRIPLDAFSFSLEGMTPAISFGPQLDERPAEWQFRLLRHAGHFRVALAAHCPATPAMAVVLRNWAR